MFVLLENIIRDATNGVGDVSFKSRLAAALGTLDISAHSSIVSVYRNPSWMDGPVTIVLGEYTPKSRETETVQPELTIDSGGPGALLILEAPNISEASYDDILKVCLANHKRSLLSHILGNSSMTYDMGLRLTKARVTATT